MRYLAKTYYGLEPILAEELASIGAKDIAIGNRSVEFVGTDKTMYRANLELRSALRILVPLKSFEIREAQQLYEGVLDIRWDRYLGVDQTFRINKFVQSDFFNNTNYAALLAKDAVADYFNRQYGRRPSVDKISPDVSIDLHVSAKQVTVSLDSSGDSLHKRGYKKATVRAPMSEVLAAGLCLIAHADEYEYLVNPMCGSGTIAIEMGLIKRNIPPQISRKRYGFMSWHSFDEEQWNLVVQGAKMRILRDANASIVAYDNAHAAVHASKANLHNAGLYRDVDLSQQNFFYSKPTKQSRGLMIMNPPYDQRLALRESKKFYASIGDHLKRQCTNMDVWIIGDAEGKGLLNLGLKPKSSRILYNGAIKCYYNEYEL